MDEEKKRHHGRRKSLAQKIADREELLKQAQEKIMGHSISDLGRFLKQKRKLEQVKNEPEPESRSEPQIHEETQ